MKTSAIILTGHPWYHDPLRTFRMDSYAYSRKNTFKAGLTAGNVDANDTHVKVLQLFPTTLSHPNRVKKFHSKK